MKTQRQTRRAGTDPGYVKPEYGTVGLAGEAAASFGAPRKRVAGLYFSSGFFVTNAAQTARVAVLRPRKRIEALTAFIISAMSKMAINRLRL